MRVEDELMRACECSPLIVFIFSVKWNQDNLMKVRKNEGGGIRDLKRESIK